MTEVNATHRLDPMEFDEAWNAGQIARFHTERVQRRQTVGEHSWGVALICLTLWPDRTDLIGGAIVHDIGELYLGDLPHPAKGLYVDVERERAAEKRLLENYADFYSLTVADGYRLKIADMMDFVFYVQREAMMGNMLVKPLVVKGTELTKRRIELLPANEQYRVLEFLNKNLSAMANAEGRYE